MNWLQRFMYGRYGNDQLGMGLLGLYLVLFLLSQILRSSILSLLSMACALIFVFRIFSRNIERRRGENVRFLKLVSPIVRHFNVWRCRQQDKDHCYFKCPNCGQQLRVPKGKGHISVTCRSCGASFEKKT